MAESLLPIPSERPTSRVVKSMNLEPGFKFRLCHSFTM